MVGKPGAGVCPVRGHSNVQGDRTMGIYHAMPPAWLDRLGRTFGFEPPRRHGVDAVGAIRAMLDGAPKVFFGLGGNFLSAAPDTERTATGLRRCALTAHVSTKLHRGHLVTGRIGLILPCLGRTEVDVQRGRPQFVTVEDSMSVVHASQGSARPASEHLLSEPRIVARLAAATLEGRGPAIAWSAMADDYDRIRDAIAQVVPGCEDYVERVGRPGGFVMRNAAREREFETSSGRARFTVQELPAHDLPPGRLLMMTIRSHDQYNTTVYGLDDRYRGIYGGRRVVLMNADDARALALSAGDEVDVTSDAALPPGQAPRVARRFRVVVYRIPRGCCAMYFPEANVLVPLDSVARESNTPASKSIVVKVAASSKSEV
jgi:molybdopterin-dependent oxidoreductase alpha subunit